MHVVHVFRIVLVELFQRLKVRVLVALDFPLTGHTGVSTTFGVVSSRSSVTILVRSSGGESAGETSF